MDVFVNGKMVPYDQAALRVDDAGLQHAVGLFETMSAWHGRVFRLDQHMERIARSARELGLAREIDAKALGHAVQRTLDHNAMRRARVRLTLTAGKVSMLPRRGGGAAPAEAEPSLVIATSPPTEYDPAYFERGVTVLIGPQIANPMDPLSGHKTLSYWSRLMLLRQAAHVGGGEVIILNISNHVASGCISNLFVVKDGQLHTPIARGEEGDGALRAPVLPGITRQVVIELATAEGMEVHRRMMGVSDLLEADEAFLTNASWGVLPVSHVEKTQLGVGEAGKTTRTLRQRLLEAIETGCNGGDFRT